MADIEALRSAIHTLFPSSVNPRFTRVPNGTTPPWTTVSISLPTPSTRAMNTRVLSSRVVVRCRVVAENDEAVWQIARMLVAALEGARVVADGWKPAPIQQLNLDPMPYEDTEVTLTKSSAHPIVLPFDFDFFATTITPPEETP